MVQVFENLHKTTFCENLDHLPSDQVSASVLILSTTASTTSVVLALPPMSAVVIPAARVSRSARMTSSPQSGKPSCSSIIAPHHIWPIGLAIPCPAMSGAEPCTGSNMEGYSLLGLIFAEGAIPILPAIAGPRSVRISPNRLLPTTTSKCCG